MGNKMGNNSQYDGQSLLDCGGPTATTDSTAQKFIDRTHFFFNDAQK